MTLRRQIKYEFEEAKMKKRLRRERAQDAHARFMAARAKYLEVKRLREEAEQQPPNRSTPPPESRGQ